jgi:hypothetical protein
VAHAAKLAKYAGQCGIFWTRIPLQPGLPLQIVEGARLKNLRNPACLSLKTIACTVKGEVTETPV